MELDLYLRFVAALVFVIALFAGLALLARRMGVGGAVPTGGRVRRLTLVEVMALDAKRRLVLVRRDDTEHLLLLGPAGDRVVEAGIGDAFRRALDTTPPDANPNTKGPNTKGRNAPEPDSKEPAP